MMLSATTNKSLDWSGETGGNGPGDSDSQSTTTVEDRQMMNGGATIATDQSEVESTVESSSPSSAPAPQPSSASASSPPQAPPNPNRPRPNSGHNISENSAITAANKASTTNLNRRQSMNNGVSGGGINGFTSSTNNNTGSTTNSLQRIAHSDSGLARHIITTNGVNYLRNPTANLSVIERKASLDANLSSHNHNNNNHHHQYNQSNRSPMNLDSSVIIQKQAERIEELESELEHIKLERDALLADNEQLCMQLQAAMTEQSSHLQPQRSGNATLDPSPLEVVLPGLHHHHHHQCSCGAPTSNTELAPNSCSVTPTTVITGVCPCGICGPQVHQHDHHHQKLTCDQADLCPLPTLINGTEPYAQCPNETMVVDGIAPSKSVSSFSSFKTMVDNFDDQPQHYHHSSHLSDHFLLRHGTVGADQVGGDGARALEHVQHPTQLCLHPDCCRPSSTVTPPASTLSTASTASSGRHQRAPAGMLVRSTPAPNPDSPPLHSPAVTPTTASFTNKTSATNVPTTQMSLSASLNLSPNSTGGGSPLFGGYSGPHHHHHHHQHTSPLHPLARTTRAAGGSSASLSTSAATNGTGYLNYELSQQLLDKHTSALERKYGGREAREAAIKIQRAFRSYRLQKRFTTLAIQAICHQQLKQKQQKQQQEEEEMAKAAAAAKSHNKQPTENSVAVVVELPARTTPKLADTLKVDSMTLAPIDREAMQHRFSRKMSANYALDDLARMQLLQQQQQQHQQQQQQQQQQQSHHSHHHQSSHPSTYLTIPRQSSPPVTLVTTYEPVYHPPPSILYNSQAPQAPPLHHYHHTVTVDIEPHTIQGPPPMQTPQATSKLLQKKTSFSSTSSTASSSSLHASSSSSKPSELTSSNGRLTSAAANVHHPPHGRLSIVQSRSQLALNSTPQSGATSGGKPLLRSSQKGQNGAVPQQQPPPLQPQPQSQSIHKTSTMTHHQMATNGAPNTVSFAPQVDYVTNVANSAEAVTSSVDAYRKRQYRVGLNLFNKSPSDRGVRFLVTNNYIEQSEVPEVQAASVAHFLLTRKGLSRQMIGEYIAEPAAFNQLVLKHFCGGVNLTGIIVDEALRAFQVHFRFPGEAQKIERLVEAFADRYKECNPSDVLSRDSIFILAFAIIMLNTDLHKPTNIKHRMTPDQWLANLKGVFSEGDLSAQFLLGIYKRIKKQELQTGGDHVTQVLKVQSTIVGKDVPNLCLPHRRLVCYCRLYEIRDLNRREKVGQHQRDVFLFNDLLLITKTTSRSRNGQMAEYQYRSTHSLDGLQVLVFSTPYYPNGIRISRRVDSKIVACFNARNDLDQQRFVDDLQEAINEMDDMEQLRIHKSSSLVQLNTAVATNTNSSNNNNNNNKSTGDHMSQQATDGGTGPSSTVVVSPSDMATTTYSSMSSINYGRDNTSSNTSNGNLTTGGGGGRLGYSMTTYK